MPLNFQLFCQVADEITGDPKQAVASGWRSVDWNVLAHCWSHTHSSHQGKGSMKKIFFRYVWQRILRLIVRLEKENLRKVAKSNWEFSRE